jgi:uncharacterized surface protein with fasciclin (FAS1) repeats
MGSTRRETRCHALAIVAIGLGALQGTGCAAVKVWALGDPSPHGQIGAFEENKEKAIGKVARSDLTSGSSLHSKAWMLGSDELMLVGGTAERLCFVGKWHLGDGDSPEAKIIEINTASLKKEKLSIRAHASLDDFAEGKPWPEPTISTADSRIVRTQKIIGETKINSDGSKSKIMDSRDIWFEYCGPAPKLDASSKYLSFIIFGENGNRIAVWELTGASELSSSPPSTGTEAASSTPTTATTSGKTLYDSAVAQGDLTLFLAIAQKSGMNDLLRGAEPYTLLIPSDALMTKQSSGIRKELEKASRAEAKAAMGKFLLKGATASSTFDKPLTKETIDGSKITFERAAGGTIKINGNRYARSEITATNGVIYVLESR